MTTRNRVTELLGVPCPSIQAPMGWIARARLASAVSNAGAMTAAVLLTGQVCGRFDSMAARYASAG